MTDTQNIFYATSMDGGEGSYYALDISEGWLHHLNRKGRSIGEMDVNGLTAYVYERSQSGKRAGKAAASLFSPMNLVLPVVGGLIAASDSLGKTKNKAHFAEISLIGGAETVNIRLADVGEGHHMANLINRMHEH